MNLRHCGIFSMISFINLSNSPLKVKDFLPIVLIGKLFQDSFSCKKASSALQPHSTYEYILLLYLICLRYVSSLFSIVLQCLFCKLNKENISSSAVFILKIISRFSLMVQVALFWVWYRLSCFLNSGLDCVLHFRGHLPNNLWYVTYALSMEYILTHAA